MSRFTPPKVNPEAMESIRKGFETMRRALEDSPEAVAKLAKAVQVRPSHGRSVATQDEPQA